MKISRRNFLKGSLTTLFLAGSGFPVYSSTKNKKNSPDRLEIKKFNPILKKMTLHKEIK